MSRSSTTSRSCVFDCIDKPKGKLASVNGGDRLEDIDERPCTVHCQWYRYCKLAWSDRGRGKYNGLSTGSGERHGLEKVAYRSALYANAGKDRRTQTSQYLQLQFTTTIHNRHGICAVCLVYRLQSFMLLIMIESNVLLLVMTTHFIFCLQVKSNLLLETLVFNSYTNTCRFEDTVNNVLTNQHQKFGNISQVIYY